MTKTVHTIYVGVFVLIVLLAFTYLLTTGLSYYQTGLAERFYHDDHTSLKPSGPIGHGLGIVGTLLILFGVSSYMTRKRVKRFRRVGVLKYWLEFHIFLCSLGPVLILFHTAFKFGGIVSISFWSMVAVVLSGVIGRFIYIQIPRTIQGRALSLDELTSMETELRRRLMNEYGLEEDSLASFLGSEQQTQEKAAGFVSNWFSSTLENRRRLRAARKVLKREINSPKDRKEVLKLMKNEMSLKGRIERLRTMQELFRYWHVAHLPFALIMLVIMIIHVGVTIAFGYRWIF